MVLIAMIASLMFTMFGCLLLTVLLERCRLHCCKQGEEYLEGEYIIFVDSHMIGI